MLKIFNFLILHLILKIFCDCCIQKGSYYFKLIMLQGCHLRNVESIC